MLFVLSGGGTAGHINPAIALAEELVARGHEVRFAGTPTGIESRLVPAAGFEFEPFEAAGFNRSHPLSLVKALKLIGERQKWNDAYEDEKSQMPTFAFGKSTDTTWLQKMDELAEKHHISILQRQPGKEVEKGDVLELQIEVRNWEGALESLVKFMHELENTAEGMFDVGYLNFKPSSKKGYMKGSFTLTCAYMREE